MYILVYKIEVKVKWWMNINTNINKILTNKGFLIVTDCLLWFFS